MTSPENNPQIEHENEDVSIVADEFAPIIPPWALLLVSAIGFAFALGVLFVSPEFNFAGWAGLAIGVLGLIVWALMFPKEVLKLIKGRTLTFGGLGVLVTIVLIASTVLVYQVIKSQGWSRDFSERDVYSLDTQVRDVLDAMGDDPSIPTVQILGFYNATSGGQRDRISVLLQDMVNNSGGKIAGYDFIDPAIQPLLTETYLGETASIPSIVIAQIDPQTGEASTTNFEVAARDLQGNLAAGQFQIINAILSLSVDGDFRAYFLNVEGALDITDASETGARGIVDDIEDEWTVEALDPLLLSSPNPPVTLNDPVASAEVMVIAGGTEPLSPEALQVIQTYIENGGDLIVLGDINTDGGTTTALDDTFATMLWDNFGVRLRDDLVIDPAIPVRQLGRVYQVNNYGTQSIVSGLNPEQNRLVFSSPHSIEISDTPPATVSVLVSTSADGYAKTGIDFTRDLTEAELAFVEGDLTGEIPLGVTAENTTTGARLVLFGSPDLMQNEWRAYSNIEAPEISQSAIFWASEAQNFSDVVRQLTPDPNEADSPVFVTEAQVRWMGIVAWGLLPFSMLVLGLLVWGARRRNRVIA
ncbi:MAG: hypothetical protein Phog2KO_46920 [Phototrophicaceae bacterium]